MSKDITGISIGFSMPHEWTRSMYADMTIKEGDMVTIVAKGTTYEVIGEVYSLTVGVSDTLTVLGSDNHLYMLSPKAYFEARNLYLELYDSKAPNEPLTVPEASDGTCTHRHTKRVSGGCLLTLYEWNKCLQCGTEV